MKWSEIGTEGWEEKLSNEISQLMRKANEKIAEAVVLAEQEFKERANKNEQAWIPVSERLPEKDGRYFVTLENGYTKILGYATTQTIRYPQGFYYISENGFAWRQTQNPVVAWMPLPEPYKGGQDETNRC